MAQAAASSDQAIATLFAAIAVRNRRGHTADLRRQSEPVNAGRHMDRENDGCKHDRSPRCLHPAFSRSMSARSAGHRLSCCALGWELRVPEHLKRPRRISIGKRRTRQLGIVDLLPLVFQPRQLVSRLLEQVLLLEDGAFDDERVQPQRHGRERDPLTARRSRERFGSDRPFECVACGVQTIEVLGPLETIGMALVQIQIADVAGSRGTSTAYCAATTTGANTRAVQMAQAAAITGQAIAPSPSRRWRYGTGGVTRPTGADKTSR